MTRRLKAEEHALWDKVISTVKPIHPQKSALMSSPERGRGPQGRRGVPVPDESPTLPATPNPKATRPPAGPPAPRPKPAITAESLDGSWDRRLGSGRVEPDITIDLHGLNREAARHLLYRRVVEAEARGQRIILVITGKGHMPGPAPADMVPGLRIGPAPRGSIKADLPRWLGEEGLTGRIAAVRRAHPRHGGAGAAYLILKRKRS